LDGFGTTRSKELCVPERLANAVPEASLPISKLEAVLKCRSCRTPRYSPRVHLITRPHHDRTNGGAARGHGS
jgi:hypothetical protein